MNLTNCSETVQTILKLQKEVYDQRIRDYKCVDVDPKEFQIKNLHAVRIQTCTDPESILYGQAFGLFVYQDGRVFQFRYNIHTPWSKGPLLSNRMTDVREVILREDYGIEHTQTRSTTFGSRAFRDRIPRHGLNEEERSLRELMEFMQAYCRREDLCAKLRKTDQAHEAWRRKNRISTTWTGACQIISKISTGSRQDQERIRL